MFKDLRELKNLGIVLKRAKAFISINGVRQTNLSKFLLENAIAT
jgi:predicted DNA-binding helix-hairpin-helix protein